MAQAPASPGVLRLNLNGRWPRLLLPKWATFSTPKAQHGPKTLHNMVFGPTTLK